MRSFSYDLIDAMPSILPATIASATTTTGVEVDCTGYRKALVAFSFGAITDANVTCALSVTAATASGGSFAAISGVAIAAMAVSAAQNKTHLLEVDLDGPGGSFLKAVLVTAGGAAYSVPVSASIWCLDPTSSPVTARGQRDR